MLMMMMMMMHENATIYSEGVEMRPDEAVIDR